MIEDVEPEVFHQLLRFILLPASLNESDGDRLVDQNTNQDRLSVLVECHALVDNFENWILRNTDNINGEKIHEKEK